MNVEVQRMLVISTAHLTHETADTLSINAASPVDGYPVFFEKRDYGWFVHVDEHGPLPSCPDDLRAILHQAMNIGAEWVMIDSDGPFHPELPTYGDFI